MIVLAARALAMIAALAAGAGLSLAVISGDGRLALAAVAFAGACASGLVMGSTLRLAPAMGLALVASTALTLAVMP